MRRIERSYASWNWQESTMMVREPDQRGREYGRENNLSETESENENLLGHLQEAMLRASGLAIERVLDEKLDHSQPIDAEYACLMSMMLEPRNPTMWNALALVHMMSNRMAEAEEAIESSLDIDTSNSWTWKIWGDLLRQEGRWMEAERAYRMASELNPQDPYAIRHLALLCISRGAHPEAAELFELLIPFLPNDQELWDSYSACLRRMRK
jgi:tetratricopeptide (TPR) repeat protein